MRFLHRHTRSRYASVECGHTMCSSFIQVGVAGGAHSSAKPCWIAFVRTRKAASQQPRFVHSSVPLSCSAASVVESMSIRASHL
jgi:hypothetical protein